MFNAATHTIAPRGLALAFTLIIVAFCCRVDNSLTYMFDLQGAILPFAIALFVGCVVGCIVIAAVPTRQVRSRLIWATIATACCVLGLVGAGLVQVLPPIESALAAGSLLGFGLTVALRQWWSLYATLVPEALLATTCVAFLFASLGWYFLQHVSNFSITCFCLIVCALCSGLLTLLCMLSADKGDEVALSRVPRLTEADVIARPSKTFMGLALAAAIGLWFNFFTLGLTYWPVAAGLSTAQISFKPLPYFIVAAVAFVLVRRAKSRRSGVVSFAHVALPIAAAIVLASPFVQAIFDLDAIPFGSTLTYVGIALFNVLGFVLPLCAIQAPGKSVARAASILVAGCAVSMLAGAVVFQALGHSAQVVSLCIMSAYLAGLVIASIRSSEHRGSVSSQYVDAQVDASQGASDLRNATMSQSSVSQAADSHSAATMSQGSASHSPEGAELPD